MNIKVLYHSSTGNTKKLADAIANELEVNAEPIGEEPILFSEPVDLLFIGDGVYFGKANKRTLSLINKLNPNTIKKVAVFATYGGQEKIGAELKKSLQDRGLSVIEEPFTCQGQSWLFLNRHHPNEQELKEVREYARKVFEKATKE